MKKYHSIYVYQAFEPIVERVECWLESLVSPLLGCDALTVKNRLTQRLVDLTLGPYTTLLSNRLRTGLSFLPPAEEEIDLAGIRIDPQSGRMRISLPALLRAIVDFGAHWLHNLWSIARIGTQRPRGKATLLFGVGAESVFIGGSDARFIEFCCQGPVAPLRQATRMIVQHAHLRGTESSTSVSYARYPIDRLACETRMSWSGRLILLFRHAMTPLHYAWAVLRCPALVLLSRDYAQSALFSALDLAGSIEAVVFTNSNYSMQPLWSRAPRSYETHMVWYSQNSIPLILKGDDFAADLPNYRHMYVDVHWVWTQGFRRHILDQFGHMQRVEVVGPVIWYLPEPPTKRLNGFNIAAFDVTPTSDTYADSIGLLANYYNRVTAFGFLNGLLESAATLRETQGANCTIQLKHKRHYSPIHDQGYIEMVSRLQGRGEINLIPFDINMYSFILDCDVVVVIPNSSPSYIANSLGVPCIYFDPTMELQPTFEPVPGVSFASGADALCEQLINIYRLKKSNNEQMSNGV